MTNIAFPLVQFPGNGPGGLVPPGLASATPSAATTLQAPVPVPEPASVLLLGTAFTLVVAHRSRRRQKNQKKDQKK